MTPEIAHPRPGRAARSEAVRVAVAGCLVTGVAAALPTVRLGLGLWFPLAAMAFFATVMSVALVTIERHHAYTRFGPANLVTAIRAGLTAIVAAMVGIGPSRPLAPFGAALLGLLVVVLDGVDGHVARRSGMTSPFGARFDMEVDALLILALAALAYRHQKAGAWVLASGLIRYAFVAGGMSWTWLRRPLEPSRRRQAVCVIQISGLLIALAPFVSTPLSAWIAAAALGALCWSFLVDVWWLWSRREHA